MGHTAVAEIQFADYIFPGARSSAPAGPRARALTRPRSL
jgi:hypothetical protein